MSDAAMTLLLVCLGLAGVVLFYAGWLRGFVVARRILLLEPPQEGSE